MKISDRHSNNDHYSIEDFYKVEKIDAHIHINTFERTILEQAVADNFIFISINVDGFPDTSIELQRDYSIKQLLNYPENFHFLTTFRVKGFEQPGWKDSVLNYLKESFDNGAVGVKVWKNIGMGEKTADGQNIFVDDAVFSPLFSYLEKNQIPLTGHIGEPKSCWLPIKKMVMKGDIDYFSKNPEYHMYLHPDEPGYEIQIERRDSMLQKYTQLVFVGAHLGSLEWSVDELAKRLDTYPLMSVDMAERICYFQYQSVENYEKVHDFIIKYQDRLLYGTDIIIDDTQNQEEESKKAHELWMRDWIYFNTDRLMTSPALVDEFKGLHLPKTVVDKIYSKNARRIYLRNK
jgi:predicted TIM-barrel fold metal-dependent hydrolase